MVEITTHDFLLTNTVLEVVKRSNTLVYASSKIETYIEHKLNLHRNRYSPYTVIHCFQSG